MGLVEGIFGPQCACGNSIPDDPEITECLQCEINHKEEDK